MEIEEATSVLKSTCPLPLSPVRERGVVFRQPQAVQRKRLASGYPFKNNHEKIITLDRGFECRWRGSALPDTADTGIWPIVFDPADQQAQRPVQSQAGNLWVQ